MIAIVSVIFLVVSGCGSDDVQQQTSDTQSDVQQTSDLDIQADEQQEPGSNSQVNEQQTPDLEREADELPASELDSQADADHPLTRDAESPSQSLGMPVLDQLVARDGINHELMIPSSWNYRRESFFGGFRITFGDDNLSMATYALTDSRVDGEPNFRFADGVFGHYHQIFEYGKFVSFAYPLSEGGILLLEVYYSSRKDLDWFYENEELILAIGRSLTHNGQRPPIQTDRLVFLDLNMEVRNPEIGHEFRIPFAWMFGQRWHNGEPNGFWVRCGVEGINIFTYMGVMDWDSPSYDEFHFHDGVVGQYWIFPDDNTFMFVRYPFGHRRENIYFFIQYDDDVDIDWFYEHQMVIWPMVASLTVR